MAVGTEVGRAERILEVEPVPSEGKRVAFGEGVGIPVEEGAHRPGRPRREDVRADFGPVCGGLRASVHEIILRTPAGSRAPDAPTRHRARKSTRRAALHNRTVHHAAIEGHGTSARGAVRFDDLASPLHLFVRRGEDLVNDRDLCRMDRHLAGVTKTADPHRFGPQRFQLVEVA